MTHKNSFWYESRESMSTDDMREIQEEKLKHQVKYGYQLAPLIRELWDDAGVSPEDIQRLEDIEKAPVFRKDEVRQRMAKTGEQFGGRLCKPFRSVAEEGGYYASTSGTTGTPTNLLFSAHDQEVYTEVIARNYWRMELRPGDSILDTIPGHAMAGDAAAEAASRVGLARSAAPHGPMHLDRYEHALEYLEPDSLVVLSPPLVSPIENALAEKGVDPRDFFEPLDSIAWTGGPLIDPVRDRLESEWGVEMYEWVGSDEPGWTIADCSEQKGWGHAPDDHFFVEVLDSETGEEVDDGERGELIVTPLSYEALSHVRWAHDDIVRVERGECECGFHGTRINFQGRVGDLVRVGGTKLLPWDILPVAYEFDEMPSGYFQFHPDSEEALRIRIAYAEDRTSDPDALADDFRRRAEDALEVPVEVVEIMTEAKMDQLGPEHKIPRIVKE
jgi:phenylacetate-CoA ligase